MHKYSKAFSIIEVLVTVTIIGILSALTITVSMSVRSTARDQERVDDINSISRRLEQVYIAQEIGASSYPSTVELLNGIAGGTGVGKWVDTAIFQAPDTLSMSVVAATSTSATNPNGIGSPTKDQYIYQPFNSSGGLCTSANSAATETDNCVRFVIFYRTETDNVVNKLASFHQQ